MNISTIIIIFILMIILFGFIYMLLSNIFINYDDRFKEYSITSKKSNNLTFFEKVFNDVWKLIKRLSKLLSKSELLKKYGNSFSKYINYKDVNRIKGIDYISIKFIISILFSLIYLISTLFRVRYNSMILLLIFIISFFMLDIYFLKLFLNSTI